MKRFIKSLQDFYLLSIGGLFGIVQRPFYWRELLEQMSYSGPNALFSVVITTFVIGMAFSVSILTQFQGLGLESEIGKVVGISVSREICPITMALLFAGRAGAGMAVELAGMVQHEQIDTLRALGVSPIKMLITPRILSSLIILPSLTLVGDFAAIVGGFYFTVIEGHFDPSLYWTSMASILTVKTLLLAGIKPLIFGYIIACISCYIGITSHGGSAGLRRTATFAFVLSTVSAMVADFLTTKVVWVFFT